MLEKDIGRVGAMQPQKPPVRVPYAAAASLTMDVVGSKDELWFELFV